MTIDRMGTATKSPMTDVHNNHFYAGGDNDINLFHGYTIDFSCLFDMSYYPFDTQKCSMIFTLQVLNNSFINPS